MSALLAAVALGLGYLLGSVLPADFFARRRMIDIRASGDGNPGTVNAIAVLGWRDGMLTAAYDLSVGVIALVVARGLGLSAGVSYLAGLMAVVGHRFPAFTRLRGGGQGLAASAGLIAYGTALAMADGWLSPASIALLVAIGLGTLALTRTDRTVPLLMLPTLLLMLFTARGPDWQYLAFMAALAAHIWAVQAIALRHHWPRMTRELRGRASR